MLKANANTGPKLHYVTCYTCPEYPEDTDSFGRGVRLQYFEWVMLNAHRASKAFLAFFSSVFLSSPTTIQRAVV